MLRIRLIATFPLWLAMPAAAPVRQQPAPGALLVAAAKSQDPDFARSVVVLIHYDPESAVGLMLNKPTDLPISQVLPELTATRLVVYAGGPIAIGIRALLRTKSPPFFSVVSSKPELLKLVSNGASPGSFRLYAGYAGWTARQLQSEVSRGLWIVQPATAREIFDPHPETLWRRAITAGSFAVCAGRQLRHLNFVQSLSAPDRKLQHPETPAPGNSSTRKLQHPETPPKHARGPGSA